MTYQEEVKKLQDECCTILARELPVFRKIMNLTQQELGELLGVSRQTIVNIENGKQMMRWEAFLAFMFIFYYNEETVDYLRSLKMPYKRLKEWLYSKSKK